MHASLDRRHFAAALAAGALVACPLARAERAAKPARVGILGSEDSPPWESFRQGLREAGYVEGRNLVIEARWSEGMTDRLPGLAAELVAHRVDVIAVSGNAAVRAAMDATRTIPIVMTVSGYPDRAGFVQSLARPGGNVTGMSNVAAALQGKRLELLKEMAPGVSRVAWLWTAAGTDAGFLAWSQTVARASGVTIQPVEVSTPEDFPAAFAAVLSGRADALMAMGNPVTFKGRRAIAQFALQHRLASIFEERLFVEAGGLMSYAASFIEMFRRAAAYVDRILRGADPGQLPVEQPARFELYLNRRTAGMLGLATPPSLLVRADGVLE